MAFNIKTGQLTRYFEQQQAAGTPEETILASIFGLISGAIAKKKAAAVPAPEAPTVETPSVETMEFEGPSGEVVKPFSEPVAPMIPEFSPGLEVIKSGCEFNELTGRFT